ncbi:multicopper oxidase family protein [Prauserella oleivorans]|uniref:Multicopper oxidase family protein n=1 Tax=Prauserella oleivorans TaxID=1478153 RepID=A0ABW5WAV9_9PSEU
MSSRDRSRTSLLSVFGDRGGKAVRYMVVGAAIGLGITGVNVVVPASDSPGAGAPVAVHQAGQADVAGQAAPAQQSAGLLGTGKAQQKQDMVDLGDGTKLAAWEMKDGVKEFVLTAAPMQWQAEPGGRVFDALSINGQIPAPTIRVNEGDKLRFVVKNEMPQPTAIHWHGMDLPNSQDGVPHLTQHPIAPGETFTYEWTAISTGTHWYHSHMHGDQEGRGLYGSLEVVPRLGEIQSDRDYRIIMGDGPLGFVFNGKSFPGTAQLRGAVGERIRLRLIGAGPEMVHSIHVHSGFFEVVAQDGHRKAIPERMDTITVSVGQTYDVIWVPTRPGKWMIHCHVFSHSETPNGMQGMVSIANIEPATARLPSIPGITSTG